MSSRGLTRVLEEVAEQVSGELEEILGKALSDAEAVVRREREETLRLVRELVEAAERRSEMARSRTLSLAEVRARGRRLEAVENYVSRVVEEALRRVEDRARRGELDKDLERLLEEAVDAVGRKELKAYTSSALIERLRNVAEEISKKKGIAINVEEEPVETRFGVVVKSLDGSVSYDNRIETRVERLKPQIKKEIASLLKD